MIELLKTFFYTERISLSLKVILVLTGLFTVLGVDYLFRLSDSFITNTKIEQIEKIEALLQNKPLRPQARQALLQLETKAIERRGLWELLPELTALTKTKIQTSNATEQTGTDKTPVRTISVFWHYATAGWIFWLSIILSLGILFNKGTSLGGAISVLIFDVMLGLLAWVFAYWLSLVPLLYDPLVNYALNVLVTGLPIGLVIWFSLRYEAEQAAIPSTKPKS